MEHSVTLSAKTDSLTDVNIFMVLCNRYDLVTAEVSGSLLYHNWFFHYRDVASKTAIIKKPCANPHMAGKWLFYKTHLGTYQTGTGANLSVGISDSPDVEPSSFVNLGFMVEDIYREYSPIISCSDSSIVGVFSPKLAIPYAIVEGMQAPVNGKILLSSTLVFNYGIGVRRCCFYDVNSGELELVRGVGFTPYLSGLYKAKEPFHSEEEAKPVANTTLAASGVLSDFQVKRAFCEISYATDDGIFSITEGNSIYALANQDPALSEAGMSINGKMFMFFGSNDYTTTLAFAYRDV